jgi:hypothetical protein
MKQHGTRSWPGIVTVLPELEHAPLAVMVGVLPVSFEVAVTVAGVTVLVDDYHTRSGAAGHRERRARIRAGTRSSESYCQP